MFGSIISALLFLNEDENKEIKKSSRFRIYEIDVEDINFKQLAVPEYLEENNLEPSAKTRDEFWIIGNEENKKIKYSRSYLIKILENYTIVEGICEENENKPKECLEDFKHIKSGDFFIKIGVYYKKINE